MVRWPVSWLGVVAVAVAIAVTACGGSSTPRRNASGRLEVVAAEDMWGSIARQLGGDHVDVTSIINNPGADPHDYEPTADDGRHIASASVVVVNGIGYDPWADNLIAANPASGRQEVNVGKVAG